MVKKLGAFVTLLLFSLTSYSYSLETIKIELLSKFFLNQEKEPIGNVWSIAVDEKENIYIPDMSFGNIKIYNNKGKLIKIFGKKGAGPGEFVKPIRIDVNDKYICVQDLGLFRYIIFDRNFKEIARFFYLISGSDNFVLSGNKLVANAYFRGEKGREFKGVILDFKGKVQKTLFPIKYPKSDAWNRIINLDALLDVSKDGEIFVAKTSKVEIFKFDKQGSLIKKFGKNPSYFIPVRRTKDFDDMLRWGRAPQGIEAGERWYTSFSWVSGIFALEDLLGIAIRKFNKNSKKWECYLQFYDFNGNLIEEKIKLKEVGYSSYNGFFMDSNHKDIFYILEINRDIDPPKYIFFKYKIHK